METGQASAAEVVAGLREEIAIIQTSLYLIRAYLRRDDHLVPDVERHLSRMEDSVKRAVFVVHHN